MRYGSWRLLRAIAGLAMIRCVELIGNVLCAYGTNISIMDDLCLQNNDI